MAAAALTEASSLLRDLRALVGEAALVTDLAAAIEAARSIGVSPATVPVELDLPGLGRVTTGTG